MHYIILAISLTLVFSQGKPCCKNKVGKSKVSCKFNQANIDATSDGAIANDGTLLTINSGIQCLRSNNNNVTNAIKCSNCTNSPWWKFWSKKKDCCNIAS